MGAVRQTHSMEVKTRISPKPPMEVGQRLGVVLRAQSLDTVFSLVVLWLLQQVMKMKRSPKHWLQVVQPQLDVVQKTHSLGEETIHPPKLSLEVGQLLDVASKAQSLELFDQLFARVEIASEKWFPLPGV